MQAKNSVHDSARLSDLKEKLATLAYMEQEANTWEEKQAFRKSKEEIIKEMKMVETHNNKRRFERITGMFH